MDVCGVRAYSGDRKYCGPGRVTARAHTEKEWFAMLPCRNSCPDYCEGCHKSCARWKTLQQEARARQQAKKAYLNYYWQLCGLIVRQCKAN